MAVAQAGRSHALGAFTPPQPGLLADADPESVEPGRSEVRDRAGQQSRRRLLPLTHLLGIGVALGNNRPARSGKLSRLGGPT